PERPAQQLACGASPVAPRWSPVRSLDIAKPTKTQGTTRTIVSRLVASSRPLDRARAFLVALGTGPFLVAGSARTRRRRLFARLGSSGDEARRSQGASSGGPIAQPRPCLGALRPAVARDRE